MTPAKICGLSSPETVRAALDGRADYIGFMFFEPSKRNVDPNLAARLAEPARGRAKIVAVTVDPDDALLDLLKTTLQPDFIQLHGKETPERVEAVRRRAGAGVIKALSIAEAADLDQIRAAGIGHPGGDGGPVRLEPDGWAQVRAALVPGRRA
jgi:phosphoribosylanthranilate isomerase